MADQDRRSVPLVVSVQTIIQGLILTAIIYFSSQVVNISKEVAVLDWRTTQLENTLHEAKKICQVSNP